MDPDEMDFLPDLKYTPISKGMALAKSTFQLPVKKKKNVPCPVPQAPFFKIAENKYLKVNIFCC
jgi:hypothetical protein